MSNLESKIKTSNNMKINSQQDLDHFRWQTVSDILQMTFLAKSGHIGGPIGFAPPMLMGVDRAKLNPEDPFNVSANKLVFGAGHYSAAAYSAITNLLIPNKRDVVVANFRSVKDVVEGHVTHHFPFIWDSTGHLGYTLAIAFAHNVADRLLGYKDTRVIAFDGDGAQTKGCIDEGQRLIVKYKEKYGLKIIHVVDVNHMQLSDATNNIMPMNIKARSEANRMPVVDEVEIDGKIVPVDGYWYEVLDDAYKKSEELGVATMLVNTVMGKGVPETEKGQYKYHGQPVKDIDAALKAINMPNKLEDYKKIREDPKQITGFEGRPKLEPKINIGERIVYDKPFACRNAADAALLDLAKKNINPENGMALDGSSPMAFIDFDLKGSVGLTGVAKEFDYNFIQVGIEENTGAMMSGVLSTRGVLAWRSMFGVFGSSMCYNEALLTAINDGNDKLITTHESIDVGQDSKTHSPINYLSLADHHGWEVFVSADANHTDAQIRYAATNWGNMNIAMGRSTLGIITKQNSEDPFYDKNYKFNPKKYDVLRDYGSDTIILTYGTPTIRAVKAAEQLANQGYKIKVINVSTPKKVPKKLVNELLNAKLIVTYEDHYVETGIAKEVKSMLQDYHMENRTAPKCRMINMGMKEYSKSDSADVLYEYFGLDEKTLVKKISNHFKKK